MTSLELANSLNMQHFSITRLIEIYKDELEEFGNIETKKIIQGQGTPGGRPREIVILNEIQRDFIIVLLKNNSKNIINLKMEIIKKIERK